jgi:periplasmic divalent cation tolerance protein
MSDCLLVMCACGSAEEADDIAQMLIEQRLAACVQAHPVTSTYRWKGQVTQDSECLLLIKTVAARLSAIEAAIKTRHSYELPEISAVPMVGGSAAYLAWVRTEVGA